MVRRMEQEVQAARDAGTRCVPRASTTCFPCSPARACWACSFGASACTCAHLPLTLTLTLTLTLILILTLTLHMCAPQGSRGGSQPQAAARGAAEAAGRWGGGGGRWQGGVVRLGWAGVGRAVGHSRATHVWLAPAPALGGRGHCWPLAASPLHGMPPSCPPTSPRTSAAHQPLPHCPSLPLHAPYCNKRPPLLL